MHVQYVPISIEKLMFNHWEELKGKCGAIIATVRMYNNYVM